MILNIIAKAVTHVRIAIKIDFAYFVNKMHQYETITIIVINFVCRVYVCVCGRVHF